MNIELRELEIGDLGWIISKHGEIYEKDFNFDSSFEIDIAKKIIAFSEKQDESKNFFIALLNGKRVGCVAISMKTEKIMFINFFFVLHKYRGQGIAKILMKKVLEHANKYNLNFIYLETYSCLEKARNLYKNFGFEIYKVNKDMKNFGHTFDQEFWKLKLT